MIHYNCDDVEEIGECAFKGNYSLQDITLMSPLFGVPFENFKIVLERF